MDLVDDDLASGIRADGRGDMQPYIGAGESCGVRPVGGTPACFGDNSCDVEKLGVSNGRVGECEGVDKGDVLAE